MYRKLIFAALAALSVSASSAAHAADGAVTVGRTARQLTTDPDDAVWGQAPATIVALVPQTIAIPDGGGSVSRIRIQALHNGRRIAFRLSWADASADAENAVDTFRDAVALLFPVGEKEPSKVSPLMGNRGVPVNIWQWRADWQADRDGADRLARRQPHTKGVWISPLDEAILKARFPGKPRPDATALEFVAEGWGTLTRQAQQDIDAGGRWRDGTWAVVFVRELKRTDASDAIFRPGSDTVLNVAVWNGAEEDVNGRKSVSLQWIPVHIR